MPAAGPAGSVGRRDEGALAARRAVGREEQLQVVDAGPLAVASLSQQRVAVAQAHEVAAVQPHFEARGQQPQVHAVAVQQLQLLPRDAGELAVVGRQLVHGVEHLVSGRLGEAHEQPGRHLFCKHSQQLDEVCRSLTSIETPSTFRRLKLASVNHCADMLKLCCLLSALGLAASSLAPSVQAANYNYVSVPFAAEMAVQLAPSSVGYGVAQSTLTGRPVVVATSGSLPAGMQVSSSPVVTTNSAQNVQATHSVALWFQFQSAITSYISLAGSASNSAANVYSNHQLFLDSGNQLCHWQSTNQGSANSVSAGGFRLCVSSAAVQPSLNWNHVAYTYDSATKVGTLYYNGQGANQATSSCLGSGCFQGNLVDRWAFGLIAGSANSGVLINHASQYNGVLTQSQVATLIQHQIDKPDVSVKRLLHFFPLNDYGSFNDEVDSGQRGKDSVTAKYSDAVFVATHNQTTPFRSVLGYSEVNDRTTYFYYTGALFNPPLWPPVAVNANSYSKLPETLRSDVPTYVPNVQSVAWQFAQTAPSRSFSVGVLVGNEQFYDLPANDYILSVLSADGNTALHLRSSAQGSGAVCATASSQSSGSAVETARVCTQPGQGVKLYDRTRLVLSYDDVRKSIGVKVSDVYEAELVRQSINWLRAPDDTNHTVRFGQFDAKQRYSALRFMGVGVQNAPAYLNSTVFNATSLFPLGYNSINLTQTSDDPANTVSPLYFAPWRFSGSDRSGQNWSASFQVSNFVQNVSRVRIESSSASASELFPFAARIARADPYLLPYVMPPSLNAGNERSFWINVDNVTLAAGTSRKWIFGSSSVRLDADASGNSTYSGPTQLGFWLSAQGRACVSLFDVTLACTFDQVQSNTWNFFSFQATPRAAGGTSVLLRRNGIVQLSRANLGLFGSWLTSSSSQVGAAITVPTYDALYSQLGPNGEPAVTAKYRYVMASSSILTGFKFWARLLSFPDRFSCAPEVPGPFSANITRSCQDPQASVLFVDDPPQLVAPEPVGTSGSTAASTAMASSTVASSSAEPSAPTASSSVASGSSELAAQSFSSSASSTAASSQAASASSTAGFVSESAGSSASLSFASSSEYSSTSLRASSSVSSAGTSTLPATSSASRLQVSSSSTASAAPGSSSAATALASSTARSAVSSTGLPRLQVSSASSSQLSPAAVAVIVVASVVASAAALGFGGYSVQRILAARSGVGERMRRVASHV